mmetsp:Transcript_129275/g.258134  ORF Transcript_129275/g.258134 Transcript_129275/m.258134 type:complete len:161 (-) Transcript_129275:55-537(-)
MAMDHTLANIYKESIDKEVKFARKMKAARGELGSAAAMAAARASLSPAQTRQSCQLNFLDQSLGLAKNPHALTASPTHKAEDLLRWGVSQEGQGRGAYLRTQGRLHPTERFGRQLTSSHEVGWTSREATKDYACSPFARRPLVQMQFYRPMGVSQSAGTL